MRAIVLCHIRQVGARLKRISAILLHPRVRLFACLSGGLALVLVADTWLVQQAYPTVTSEQRHALGTAAETIHEAVWDAQETQRRARALAHAADGLAVASGATPKGQQPPESASERAHDEFVRRLDDWRTAEPTDDRLHAAANSLQRVVRSLDAQNLPFLETLAAEPGRLYQGLGSTTTILLVLLLAIVASLPDRSLGEFFARVGQKLTAIKTPWVSLDLGEGDVQRSRLAIQVSLRNEVNLAMASYADLARQHDLTRKVGQLAQRLRRQMDEDQRPASFRLTLHVPFFVSGNQLVQVTDYFGPDGKELRLPGVYRLFSTRFGIIGRAWRSRKSEYDPAVPTLEEELVRSWGMTADEAADARSQARKTFLAVVLKEPDPQPERARPLAVIYADAAGLAAFDAERESTLSQDFLALAGPNEDRARRASDWGHSQKLNERAVTDRIEALESALVSQATQNQLIESLVAMSKELRWFDPLDGASR
ncbi:MAG: hypothetical protein B7733_21695 [Myxococcales bacterium FL481]|nr:MAG: hypothetical protein B7733_21695 [Myxococcales bacterium FL481]